MIGIYLIKNKINGKSYVGSSKDIERRFRQHKKAAAEKPLYAEMAIYGLEAFDFLVLEELKEYDAKELHRKEQYYIEQLSPEYNTIKASTGIEVSQRENFNEYHRLYLQTQEKYKMEHTEYCRKWNREHKDYFRKYYLEHKK